MRRAFVCGGGMEISASRTSAGSRELPDFNTRRSSALLKTLLTLCLRRGLHSLKRCQHMCLPREKKKEEKKHKIPSSGGSKLKR